MDLSNHVILPREDYIDLQTAAWDQNPMSGKERATATLQTSAVFAAAAAAYVGAMWGWAKVQDWRDERKFQRQMRAKREELT